MYYELVDSIRVTMNEFVDLAAFNSFWAGFGYLRQQLEDSIGNQPFVLTRTLKKKIKSIHSTLQEASNFKELNELIEKQ